MRYAYWVLLVGACFSLFLNVSTSSAENIYVDNTLSADCVEGNYSIAERACNGEDGNGYTTIAKAITMMNGGDDIYLRGGDYYERELYISDTKSGSIDNWSSMQSLPGEWAVIDGQRQCFSVSRAVIRNGGFAHEGTKSFAKYWLFERLEIMGGGESGVLGVPAAGIWWNKGPLKVRYCYIHDNLADDANGNPAGLTGDSQQNWTIEYNYFKNNGAIGHPTHNSRNIQITGESWYSTTVPNPDPNWYTHGNEIRYNYFETQGGVGIGMKSWQAMTLTRDGSDTSRRDWGDKIHHNIIVGPAELGSSNGMYGIQYQADYVQIYNNIIHMGAGAGEACYGIALLETPAAYEVLEQVVYNNTIINSGGAGIHNSWANLHKSPAVFYVYNNIISHNTNDWDRSDISFGASSYVPAEVPLNDIYLDRNYFYNTVSPISITIGANDWTVEQYLASTPHTNEKNWATTSESSTLFKGVTGADQYVTLGNHHLELGVEISNGGVNISHPYLAGERIPSYVGATDPRTDNTWVYGVINDLSNTNWLRNQTNENPSWAIVAPRINSIEIN